MNAYLAILILYGVGLFGAGLFLARRVRTASDFFVAGRRLGGGLLFSTLLMANIGAGSTMGAASLGYRLGLSAWWWVGSAGIGCLILAFTVGPRIWEIAKRHNLYTAGDFLERRYGPSVRIVVSVLLWFGTLAILAGQLIAFAWILSAVAGTSKTVGCILGGVVAAAYFAAGGLHGAAHINLLQLVFQTAGFVFGIPLALAAVGGWGGMRETLAGQGVATEVYLNPFGVGWSGIFAYLVLLAPSFIVSPGLLQKIYGARDRSTVRWGTAANGVALLFFSILPVVFGMIARAAFPDLPNPDLALPTVITRLLPFGLGALLLVALFSAELSSADAILFMLSTSLTRDLYQRFLRPDLGEEALLRLSRWVSLGAGFCGVLLAIWLEGIISTLSIFYGLLSISLFVPVVVGLYWTRLSAGACLGAIVAGLSSAVVFQLATGGVAFGWLTTTALGILVSLAIALVSLRR